MIFPDIDAYRASGFAPQVAVIGAGPAGVTVARRLDAAGVPCVLLDAGGKDYSDASQDFYRGRVFGDAYADLDAARLRYLGGTSGHWTGWCRMLDRRDFEARDWIPNSGWPVGLDAIEPYVPAAQDILELPEFKPNRAVATGLERIDLIRSEPVRFGDKFREELETSANVAVVLNTYATDLKAEGRQVTAANLHSNGRTAGELKAQRFVVATGGIENSRLLLWSNLVSPDPVVPDARALGRYWMEHPEFYSAETVIWNTEAIRPDEDGTAFFAPSDAMMREAGVMNFTAIVEPHDYYGTKRIIADLACTAGGAGEWLLQQAGTNVICGARVLMAWEQAPAYDNHVTLSLADTDAAGVPRPELHWRKGELERKTLTEGVKLVGAAFAAGEIGRVRLDPWVLGGGEYPADNGSWGFGYHHMGGTRMSADARTGVVDADCRVHGMANLYVAGSSIFATGGYANPTMTLVAFAERLGAHLAGNAA